jgi:hypothetical protein
VRESCVSRDTSWNARRAMALIDSLESLLDLHADSRLLEGPTHLLGNAHEAMAEEDGELDRVHDGRVELLAGSQADVNAARDELRYSTS